MTKEELKDQLTPIFRQTFSEPELTLNDEMNSNDVDRWDSLTHMQLISRIEEMFCIKFKLKELNRLKRVGDLMEVVLTKING